MSWDKTDDPSLKGQEITVLLVDTDGTLEPIVKQFTDETGIKVKMLAVDYNSLYNKITTAALSNSSDIDVIEMDTIWAGQFLKGNLVVDLTDIVPQNVKDTFTQSSLSSVEYNGHLAAIPYYSSTKHFYWNMDLLKKAGYDAPPKTWSEFREMSKKLTKNGVYASGWSWKQAESLNCDYVAMVYAFGGDFFGQDGKIKANSPEAVKALQFMVDILNTDKTVNPASLQWAEDDVTKAFEAGKIAMMSNWEGQYPELNDPSKSKVVNQTDVGLLPGEGNVKSASVTGSEGVAIMQASQKKQAALAFVKWIGEKHFQLENFAERGTYPALKSLYSDPAMKEADSTNTIDKIQEQFSFGVNRPNAPGYVEWADILSAQVFSALTGHVTPQEALDNAQQKIEAAIAAKQ
ncbi:MAG TPA: extracellular solute-binding protein [Bacilli bacterium]